MRNIEKIINKFGIKSKDYELYGNECAKVKYETYTHNYKKPNNKKLILVTAISPTPSGEGKTTIAIGLNDCLNALGKKSILCLRQPSIGPTLGIKGGATGNGKSQILPEKLINYGLTGDFFVIETINNLIASIIDNHIYHGNELNIDPKTICWHRVMDLSDRSLRDINVKINSKINYNTAFDITAASEIMAILCLSKSMDDFVNRINNIVVAYDIKKKPIYVKSFKLDNAIKELAKKLLYPNCVATYNNNLCLIHGGPFANIAHGCSSTISINTAYKYANYVVTEAGFGSDLGAEKFINIFSREYAQPDAIILCVTFKSILYHCNELELGWKERFDIGTKNLMQHINSLRNFGIDPIIAINLFPNDKKEEIDYLINFLKSKKLLYSITSPSMVGQKSFKNIVEILNKCLCKPIKIKYTYNLNDSTKTKIDKIVSKVYGFKTKVEYEKLAQDKLKLYDNLNGYYVCMAKTPISYSSDLHKLTYSDKDKIIIKDIIIANGVKFVIPVSQGIYRIPGLPKVPNAQK